MLLLLGMFVSTGYSQVIDSNLFMSPERPLLFDGEPDSIAVSQSELTVLINKRPGDTVNFSQVLVSFPRFVVTMKAGDENNKVVALKCIDKPTLVMHIEQSLLPGARHTWIGIIMAADYGDSYTLKVLGHQAYWKKVKQSEVVER